MTKCLRHNLNTLEDWIHQMAEFEKKMAESLCQIAEFKKTMNKSLDHMGEAEKTMAKIARTLSNKHTNKDQSAHRAS